MNYQLTSEFLEDRNDESFDNLTQLATFLLNVPVSLVSLIDKANDRQVFKSQIGLKEPWATKMETPLSHSFCKHVAHNGTTLSIEDAENHDLVRDNLAIPELGVRAYLGTPIRDESDHVIGAFCVISGVKRSWNDADKETMSLMSSCVSNMIKMKAAYSRESARSKEHQKITSFLLQNLKIQTSHLVALHNDLEAMVRLNADPDISQILEKHKEATHNINTLIEGSLL